VQALRLFRRPTSEVRQIMRPVYCNNTKKKVLRREYMFPPGTRYARGFAPSLLYDSSDGQEYITRTAA